MKNIVQKSKNKALWVSVVLAGLIPSGFAWAQGGGVSGGSAKKVSTLGNPIGGVNSVSDLVAALLKIVVKIGIPIATIFIIYAGFLFVTSRGDTTKLADAKTTLLWTIVGTALLLGASLIADVIGGTIKALQ